MTAGPYRRWAFHTTEGDAVRAKVARAVLIGLAVVSVLLLTMLLYPLATALLFAAVLAGAFLPAVNRIAPPWAGGGRSPPPSRPPPSRC
jgi:hypothetical protein